MHEMLLIMKIIIWRIRIYLSTLSLFINKDLIDVNHEHFIPVLNSALSVFTHSIVLGSHMVPV